MPETWDDCSRVQREEGEEVISLTICLQTRTEMSLRRRAVEASYRVPIQPEEKTTKLFNHRQQKL